MRLLLLNPNTSDALTAYMVAAARAVAAPGTEIVPATAPRGLPYIATRAEATLAGGIVLEMLAEHAAGMDGVIIAAFGDPGLPAARELLPIPVVGMAEAAMLTACMLGRRFAIVTFSPVLVPWFEDCVAYNGLADRFAGCCTEGSGFTAIDRVQDEKEQLMIELAERAVADLGADVVVFAGAPLAGLAARVRDRIPVPVVDGAAASVKQAETLVALRPRKPIAGSFRAPAAKPMRGIDAKLAALFGNS